MEIKVIDVSANQEKLINKLYEHLNLEKEI